MTKTITLKKLTGLNWHNKTIVVVEDADGGNLLTEAALQKTGARIISVRNCRDSIDIIGENNGADLLIMDITLPETDCYETVRQIKTLWPKLPVVAQTSYVMGSKKGSLLQQACDEYIIKPFELKDLLALCVKYIGN